MGVAKGLQPAMMILWTNDPLIKREMDQEGPIWPVTCRFVAGAVNLGSSRHDGGELCASRGYRSLRRLGARAAPTADPWQLAAASSISSVPPGEYFLGVGRWGF